MTIMPKQPDNSTKHPAAREPVGAGVPDRDSVNAKAVDRSGKSREPSPEAVAAGYAIYTRKTLKLYDVVVHGVTNHLIWRCPTRHLRALYDRHVTDRHLDVGVGTGYFLDRATFPFQTPDITLVDPNKACLDRAAARIARYRPTTVAASAFDPLPVEGPFTSAGLCYLFHCLPGRLADKAIVFDRLKPVLAPDAVVFGATILQGDAPRGWAARRLMATYNKRGTFSNEEDNLDELKAALDARFASVDIQMIGCVALFAAR